MKSCQYKWTIFQFQDPFILLTLIQTISILLTPQGKKLYFVFYSLPLLSAIAQQINVGIGE